MRDKNDKYADDETDNRSQVRSILSKLAEERPSQEKKREVVVREDGTKVIRVTKKRRVMISAEEKKRRARRGVMWTLFSFFVLLLLTVAFFAYRITVMTGDEYLSGKVEELKRLWGCTELRCDGLKLTASGFSVDRLEARFPETSMLESVALSKVDGDVGLLSLATGVLRTERTAIGAADIVLRVGDGLLHLDRANPAGLWQMGRVECSRLNVAWKDGDATPVVLTDVAGYMYAVPSRQDTTSLVMHDGKLQMRGWPAVRLTEGKMLISDYAVPSFSFTGTTDNPTSTAPGTESRLSVSGEIAERGALAGPFVFDADNMSLGALTRDAFVSFLQARTLGAAQAGADAAGTVKLPFATDHPVFGGMVRVKGVELQGFPAMEVIAEHLERQNRKNFQRLKLFRGVVRLSEQEGANVLTLQEGDMEERRLVTLKGELRVSAPEDGRKLSGTLEYGLPSRLTRTEYADGVPDPLFDDDGSFSRVVTTLSGTADSPRDNSSELDARAGVARANRTGRRPADMDIDIDQFAKDFTEKHREAEAILRGDESDSTPAPQSGGSAPSGVAPFGNDPFATPSSGTPWPQSN